MYDLFDALIAEELNMTIEDYIVYIESLSEEDRLKIIEPILENLFKNIGKIIK